MNSRQNMRFFVSTVLASIVFAVLPAVSRAAEQLYTCGMHPQIIKKEPGNCPICGMKLTPIIGSAKKGSAPAAGSSGEHKIKYYKSTMIPGEVKPGPGKDSMGMDLVPVYEDEDNSAERRIQIDAATIQRMNLKTGVVGHGPVRRDIRTVGTVTYNEEGLADITTKYEGWIEKLYVNSTWSTVKAGDPLFEIYSPDLYNAELNYLTALKTETGGSGPLTRSALNRLRLFDVPAEFIDDLKHSGEAKRTFLFRSPVSGVVTEKMAVAGQMVKPGERIYRLADLSTVWVEAQIYEKDLPFITVGRAAKITTSYGPGRSFSAPVELLLPQVQEETRSATARIVLQNRDGFLRPGMFVEVAFSAELAGDAVLVPDVAVLRSGERNTVFVALDGGFFEPREVKLGFRSEGDFYEVLGGLKAGERVVTSGQFMLDSESQLREAIQKMLRSPSDGTPPPPASVPALVPLQTQSHEGHSASTREMPPAGSTGTLYTCPMPEDADVVQDHPGKCSKCGMKLVLTSEVEHRAEAEKNWHKQHAPEADPVHPHSAFPPVTKPTGNDVVASIRAAFGKPSQPSSAMPVLPKAGAGSEGGCGGCGMSEAAMAAGEPCLRGQM